MTGRREHLAEYKFNVPICLCDLLAYDRAKVGTVNGLFRVVHRQSSSRFVPNFTLLLSRGSGLKYKRRGRESNPRCSEHRRSEFIRLLANPVAVPLRFVGARPKVLDAFDLALSALQHIQAELESARLQSPRSFAAFYR